MGWSDDRHQFHDPVNIDSTKTLKGGSFPAAALFCD